MLTATIRGMLAHKLRLALTTASIALGVAFLAGTFVLTDTMGLASRSSSARSRRHRRGRPHRGAVLRQRGHRHQPWPDRRVRPPAGREGRRRAHGRGLGHGYALLTDNDGRAILTKGARPRRATAWPPTSGSAVTSTCCPARPGRPPTRWPSTRPAPRSTTSRSAPRSRCCSRDRPRSSPWSAPSASAARRTSAAPRRRTSTRRPRSGSSAAPASSTRSG